MNLLCGRFATSWRWKKKQQNLERSCTSLLFPFLRALILLPRLGLPDRCPQVKVARLSNIPQYVAYPPLLLFLLLLSLKSLSSRVSNSVISNVNNVNVRCYILPELLWLWKSDANARELCALIGMWNCESHVLQERFTPGKTRTAHKTQGRERCMWFASSASLSPVNTHSWSSSSEFFT